MKATDGGGKRKPLAGRVKLKVFYFVLKGTGHKSADLRCFRINGRSKGVPEVEKKQKQAVIFLSKKSKNQGKTDA